MLPTGGRSGAEVRQEAQDRRADGGHSLQGPPVHSQGCAQHSHAHSRRTNSMLAPLRTERRMLKGVFVCRHGRGRPSMRWTRTKAAAAAAALLPSPKKRSATAVLPVSTAFFVLSPDRGVSGVCCAGGQASVVPAQAALQVQVRAKTSPQLCRIRLARPTNDSLETAAAETQGVVMRAGRPPARI